MNAIEQDFFQQGGDYSDRAAYIKWLERKYKFLKAGKRYLLNEITDICELCDVNKAERCEGCHNLNVNGFRNKEVIVYD